MSTVKNVSKRSSTTNEQVSSKTTTKKVNKEATKKSSTNSQKKPPSKPPDEKELLTKVSALKKETASVNSKKTSESLIDKRNVSGPSKKSTSSKASTSPKPSSKTKSQSTSSSRVTRSQYYPSKQLFSNALKSAEMQSKQLDQEVKIKVTTPRKEESKSIDRTKKSPAIRSSSKLISKSEPKHSSTSTKKTSENDTELNRSVEEAKSSARDSSPETSSMLDRPRTATLRKGSIVNENIVGPEAPKLKSRTIPDIKEALKSDTETAMSLLTSEENYEEDFESYESDFEAASSSEDTINLDNISRHSGSISSSGDDISEQRQLSPVSLQNDIKRTSSAGTDSERKLDSGTFELSDFKHRQILRYIEDTVRKEDAILEQDSSKEVYNHASLSDEGFEDQKSLQFINFAGAKKKCELRRASAARRRRGQELISMIKLNAMNFTIFDSPVVPYDVYIKNYGHSSSVQASVQTGEDDVCEEVQTDTIDQSSKWTQMPNKFSTFEQNSDAFWANYKSEYLGVGEEEEQQQIRTEASTVINKIRLANFVKRSSELMLQILAEESFSNMENVRKNKNDIPFSNGYLQFNTSQDMLKNTTIRHISIVPKKTSQIISVHTKTKLELDLIGSVVCIWDVADLEAPRMVFVAFGEMCCAALSVECERYVLGGQYDGTLLVWNIEENRRLLEISQRTPSFVTPIGSSHFAKVISIQSVSEKQDYALGECMEDELCTLDESGKIIIWTLYSESKSAQSINGIVLLNTQVIHLADMYPQLSDLLCSDCIIMQGHIYVSTNYGFILQCVLKSNQANARMFLSESNIDSTCVEKCPFSPLYFVAGYSNGDIFLFSRTTERPLLVLQNKEQMESSSIHMIRWSKTKPFLFYVKDLENNIHVWDLQKSDLYPEYSINFPVKISCFKLSTTLNKCERDESAFMIIGTEDGKLYMHLLTSEYGRQTLESYQEDVKIFLNYVNRL